MHKTNPPSLDFTKSSWLALKTGLTKSSILFCFFVFFLLCVGLQNARGQTLGTYSNTSVVSGKNTVINPSAAPTGTTSAVAYTSTNFTGVLTVNPTSGDVTVTDAKQAGTYTVTVKAFGSGTATTTFTLTVTNPICSAGLLSGSTNTSVGTSPILVTIGDFNGDGKQDFATTNDGASAVSIRIGDGSGGFSGTTNVSVGSNPRSVAIGDFNGDGKQDFAAANHGSNTVSIRLGNGSGGFSGTTNISVGTGPRSVAIGDFNGDGKQDFAAANENTANVSIRLGDGSGGFSGTTNISTGTGPISVAIGDFDGDGKQDFATANYSANTVSIRLGNGSGGFTGTTNISVGTTPFSVAVGDFNGDGKQDFAAANNGSANVSIRLGDGSGGFSGTTNISVGTNPYSVAIGDFNGDGKQDFAAANQNSNTVSIRLGNGSGGFSGSTNIGVGTTPTSVAVGDFNGDGKQDFAAANYTTNNVSIRLGEGNEINVQGNGSNIVSGDLTPADADWTNLGPGVFTRTFTIQNTGNATLTLGSNAVSISGANAGDFSITTQPATTVAAAGTTTFDVTFSRLGSGIRNATLSIANDDCDESPYTFAISTAAEPTLGTYANTSVVSGKNTVINPSAAPTGTTSAVAYTNSNFTGLLTVNPTTGAVTVTDAMQAGTYTVTVKAFGSGTATTTFTLTVTNPTCSQGLFSGTTDIGVGTQPYSVAIGDFNADGKQDFAATSANSSTVSIRLGNGSGGFSGTTSISVGTNPYSVAIGDFDGDGKQDFAAANSTTANVSIRLGNGSGVFSGTTDIGVGTQPYSVAIGDFNADGNQDFAAANAGSNTVSIRLGNGSGGFSGTTNISVGTQPLSVAVGDFNGDGKQDFATANNNASNVSIRLGNGSGGFSGTTNIGVGSSPKSVAIGDFNADGKQDFAAANYNNNTVSIRLGDGSGGFSGTTNISVGTKPYSVAIGDFNSDGKQDFAATNQNSASVSIRLGNGSGGFSGTTNIGIGTNPFSVAIGDFNGDGKQDFAATNFSSDNVSIRLGQGNEINVQGNAVDIADGDVTPSTSDHTDFGNGVFSRTFTIQNSGNGTLTLGNNAVTITGANAADFSVNTQPATSVTEAGSSTFVIDFSLTATGVRNATVNIANDDCDESPYNFDITALGCINPTVPTLDANSSSICGNQSSTLSISSGTLNSATNWQWYSTSCGGTSVGSGTSVNVSPVVTTTYYARGEGGCVTPGSCGNITVTVTGPGIPTGANVYSGNITITTQTQMDAFYTTGGANDGKKWSEIDGNLILDGSHSSDPITSLCNLSELRIVTGHLYIQNFNKSGNPTDLKNLYKLKDVKNGLIIKSNSQLIDMSLPKLAIVWNGMEISNNSALIGINMPKLHNVKLSLKITNNPKTESMRLSADTNFVFSRAGADVEISNNGGTAANPLTMDFKKMGDRLENLIFNNNDNSGVNNFDNIFTGLTSVKTMTVTNNDYLGTCCKVATTTVTTSRTVSGNTGNCADITAVTTACGALQKMSPKTTVIASLETSFDVYPNPSKGQFGLDVSLSEPGVINIIVTDLMGRVVLTQNQAVNLETNIPLNLDFTADGQYILKAEVNGEKFVKRLVVVK